MSNPMPRPALQKAKDAAIHPATARQDLNDPVDVLPAAKARQEPTKPRSARAPSTRAPATTSRKFGGSTSDHLRMPDQPTEPATQVEPATPRVPIDLMGGKTTTLDIVVPKRLSKAAKAQAKARGLDVDAIVCELLHAWLTGAP